jgi:hypothetical protein
MRRRTVHLAALAVIAGMGGISGAPQVVANGERASAPPKVEKPSKPVPSEPSDKKPVRRFGREPNPASPSNIKRHLPTTVAAMRRASGKRKNISRNKTHHRGPRA